MMPLISFFAAAPEFCKTEFLGLLPWFQYLPFYPTSDKTDPNYCQINLDFANPNSWNQLWLIGIAIIDDLLRVAGTVAVILVIYGAVRYITSQGDPENVKGAQSTILNALIGLGIAAISVSAINFIGDQLGGTAGSSGLPNIVADGNLFSNILNLALGLIGAISLLMVTLGGFKYITSGGDPQKTNSAKNTILYSLIGLGISVFAFAIVNFVLLKLQ